MTEGEDNGNCMKKELKMDGEVSKKVSSNKDDYWVQNRSFLCEAETEWKTQSKPRVDKPTDPDCKNLFKGV